jgi:hypothetical protein
MDGGIGSADAGGAVCAHSFIPPLRPLFRRAEPTAAGQTSLFRLLVAYAQHDPAIGYCQGMGFVCAVLLSYMTEADAFRGLIARE